MRLCGACRLALLALLAESIAAPAPAAAAPNPFIIEPGAGTDASSGGAPAGPAVVCAPWDTACLDSQGGGQAGLVSAGSAVCWGRGNQAEPYLVDPAQPVVRVDTSLGFRQLSGQSGFVCGLTNAGTIACWGSATPMDDSRPGWQPPTEVEYRGSGSGGTAGAAGADSEAGAGDEEAAAAAATDAPETKDAEAAAKPEAAARSSQDRFTQVVTGERFACGLLANASTLCFGHLPEGADVWSGPPAAGRDQAITPALVGGDALQWAQLAADSEQVVGVLANGSLAYFWAPWADEPHPFCGMQQGEDASEGGDAWQDGWSGNWTEPVPRLAADPSLTFTAAAAGDGGLRCGLLANGSIACMCGWADAAQQEPLSAEPRLMFGGGKFTAVAARRGTVCGLPEGGGLVCGGLTGAYLTPEGFPETVFSSDPVVVDDERRYTALSVGGSGLTFHACALADPDGQAYCFGLNSEGQLGLAPGSGGGAAAANSSDSLAPVDTRLRFTQLAAGGAFTCGVVGGVSAASADRGAAAEGAPAPRASAAAAPDSGPAPDAAPAPSSR